MAEHDSVTPATRSALWDDVSQWLHENWDPDLLVEDWWQLVAKAGWTAPTSPWNRVDGGLRTLRPRSGPPSPPTVPSAPPVVWAS